MNRRTLSPTRAWPRLLAAALLLPALAMAQSQRTGHAHQHGIAKLDVVIDGQRIDVGLEMPLDNLVGFERAPRTADEKRQVEAAVATLKAAATWFRIDPAGGCRLREVNLSSAALGLGTAGKAAAGDGHADIDADVGFDCGSAAQARQVEIGLFKAFPRLQRLEVQVAAPKRQFKRSLKRPDGMLSLQP